MRLPRIIFRTKRITLICVGLFMIAVISYKSAQGPDISSSQTDQIVRDIIQELDTADDDDEPRSDLPCATYKWAAATKRHVIVDVTGNQHNVDTSLDLVTMVTHMSDERINKLHLITHHWPGPISVAVYVKRKNLKNFISALPTRDNILYHIVLAKGSFYPVNHLRNIALKATRTKFTFLSDIDFIPSEDCYTVISNNVRTLQRLTALVIPVFEEPSQETRLEAKFPATRKELVALWKPWEKILPFHYYIFKPGQEPTDSDKWAEATQPYKVEWSRWYEPYIVAHTDAVPMYNEQLVARYENKALHTAELHARGFEFTVLPDAFLLHLWHKPIPLNKSIYNCSYEVSRSYTRYLEKTYQVKLI